MHHDTIIAAVPRRVYANGKLFYLDDDKKVPMTDDMLK